MKQGITILLVLTLVLSMVTPVFGTFGDTFGDTGTEGEVQGTGGTVILETAGDIFRGYIPTSATLDFVIDPLGLLDMEAGDIIDLDNRNNIVNFNHEIFGETAGDTLFAYNMSSVPVLLTVGMSVNASAGVEVVHEESGVTDGQTDSASVLIWMEPNAEVVNDSEGDVNFEGIGRVIPFAGGSRTDVHYRLEEVEHDLVFLSIEGDFPNQTARVELQPADDAAEMYGTGFRFGGVFNRFGTWTTDPNLALSIEVVFDITPIYRGCTVLGLDVEEDDIPFYRTDGDIVAYGLLGAVVAFQGGGRDAAPGPVTLNSTDPTLIPRPYQTGDPRTLTANADGWVSIPVPSGITVAGVGLGDPATWVVPNPARLIHNAVTNYVHILIPVGEHQIVIRSRPDYAEVARAIGVRS